MDEVIKQSQMPRRREGSKESVEKLQEKVEKFQELFSARYDLGGIVRGRFGEEYFSGDGASFFTLLHDKSGRVTLVKLGWGEVSQDTFLADIDDLMEKYGDKGLLKPEVNNKTQQGFEDIRNLPVPFYVVRQGQSYFADEKLKELILKDPEKYLKENALFVFNDGQFTGQAVDQVVDQKRRTKRLPLENLPMADVDEAIKALQN